MPWDALFFFPPPLRFQPSFRLLLRWIALANFDPWCFFEELSKWACSLSFSADFLWLPMEPDLELSGFHTPNLQDLLPQCEALLLLLCRKALQQCRQSSYLAHPHTRAQTFLFLFLDSEPVFCGSLFPTPGWAQILSALCKPAPLCHQDYRLCCSRLMTDISTLLSALHCTHSYQDRMRGCLWWRVEQLRGR